MTTRLLKWGVILMLILGVGYACFQWGYSSSQENAAEKRQAAVEKAIEEREAKFQEQLKTVQKEKEAYRKRLNEAYSSLETKNEKIENMEGGERACFDQDSLRLYNQY